MQHLYSATVHVNTGLQGSIMNISHAFEIVVRHFSSGWRPLLVVCCLSKMFGSKIFHLYFPSFGKLASIVKFFNYERLWELLHDVVLILAALMVYPLNWAPSKSS